MSRLLLLLLLAFLTLSQAHEICLPVKKCLSRLRRDKPCPLLPVPRASIPAPPPAAGFSLVTFRPGVYSYFDGAYLSLILYKSRRLALVDFPDSPQSVGPDGEYLLATAVAKVLAGTSPRRIDMVYSHRHRDHIGRAGFMKSLAEQTFPGVKIFVWGTSESVEFIRRADMPAVPEPTAIVGPSGRTVDVAPGLKLRLKVVGGHTQMDLACHIPPSRDGKGVLHYVDVVLPGSVPFLDFAFTSDLERYLEAQKEVLDLDWDIFSPGHGRLGDKSDIERNVRYTQFVVKAASNASAEVDPEKLAEIGRLVSDPTAPQFANGGWAFAQNIQLQVDVCARKVIRKWGCVLAAADVFSPSHCKEAGIFTQIENLEI